MSLNYLVYAGSWPCKLILLYSEGAQSDSKRPLPQAQKVRWCILFAMKSTILVSAILSLCRFGDHVLLFSGSTAMMLMFEASFSQISFFVVVFCFCFLFLFFIPPSDPKSGKSIDAKRIKRGWSKPYGFFLGFVTSSLLCISVFLFFVLSCFVFFFQWNKLKLKPVRRSPISDFFFEMHERAYKNKKREDLLTATAMGWGLGSLLRFGSLARRQTVQNKRKNVGGHTIHI